MYGVNDNQELGSPAEKARTRWSPHTVVFATVFAVTIGVGLILLYRFYMIVFLLFVALSIATALKPLARWLQQRKLPVALGVVPIYFMGTFVLVGLLWLISPSLGDQLGAIVNDLPTYYATLRTYLQSSSNSILQLLGGFLPADLTLPMRQISVAETAEAVDPIGMVGQAISTTGKVIFLVVGVLLIAYYWLIEGDMVIRRLLLRTRMEKREDLRALITEIEDKIGAYFRGQFLLCMMIGVLSLLAFVLIGVPHALTLALISGITEAVPVIGPTLSAVPAILLTLSTAPEKALWVIIALVLIQSMENHLLVPKIMDRSVGVHPLVTILAIAAFGLLFGIVGAILAIPLAAILQILAQRLLFVKTTNDESVDLTLDEQQPTRNRFSVLRWEAEDLAQDVRKQVRKRSSHGVEAQLEEAEDMLETVALNLQGYLLQKENAE